MANINIGTIFALEANLPKFEHISNLAGLKFNDRKNALKNMQLFSDLKETDEILSYLTHKEHTLWIDSLKIAESDQFFSNLFWLKQNMVTLRKIIRKWYLKRNNEQANKELGQNISKLSGANSKILEIIEVFYQDLPSGLSMFELEQKLDKLYWKLLKSKTGRSSVKKEYSKLFENTYKISVKSRIDYLASGIKIAEDVIDQADKEFAQREINYVNQALLDTNEDLVMLSYLTKIKYLFYNLQLLFVTAGKVNQNLLVNYSFR